MSVIWSKYQEDIFEAVRGTSDSLCIEAVAGCLAGSTKIGVNRGGRSYTCELDDLVHMFNGGSRSGKCFDSSIETRIRSVENGMVRLAPLAGAIHSGLKLTWNVRTESGHEVRATEDHQFLTEDGWKRLNELRWTGEFLLVDGGKGNGGTGVKPSYRYVYQMDAHPFRSVTHNRSRAYYRVPEHRLVLEAALNGVEYEIFLLEIQEGKTEGYIFLDPQMVHVHHRNEDSLDNRLKNLEVMSIAEHQSYHARNGGWENVQAHVMPSRLASIGSSMWEETYDLTMAEGSQPNFLANGIVVHNSGKTTTIVEAINYVPRGRKIAFMAFNKSIADTLKRKVQRQEATCGTFHSFGLKAWKRLLFERAQGLRIEGDKVRQIVRELLTYQESKKWPAVGRLVGLAKQAGIVPRGAISLPGEFVDERDRTAGVSALGGKTALMDLPLVKMGLELQGLMEDTDENWLGLCQEYGIDEEEVDLQKCRKVLEESILSATETVDFDDMLYMPIVGGAKFELYDVVFVDEWQDTNQIQHEMVQRMQGGRVVVVGDQNQAIYAFRGSLPNCMEIARERFSCRPLPLSISYRCPKSVVKRAQVWVENIQASEEAGEGLVVDYAPGRMKLQDFKQGDALLCRLTRPLVAMAFRFIRAKIPARIVGRDLGKGLVGFVNKSRLGDQEPLSRFEEWLTKYEARETDKLRAREEWGKLGALEDKIATVRVFVSGLQDSRQDDFRAIGQDGMTPNPQNRSSIAPTPLSASAKATPWVVGNLKSEIEALFQDSGRLGIALSTIHKAKGLEFRRVFVLDADSLMPCPWATNLQEEKNLCYVACTRAMEELHYVRGEDIRE